MKQRIGVIFGGKSSEKEISLATGRYILNLLDPLRFQGIPLYMDSSGDIWELPVKLILMNTTKDVDARLKKEAKKIDYENLNEIVDFVFIVLLGKFGEDGSFQGILEILKLPYSGSRILASAVCMNKKLVKDLLEAEKMHVPKDIVTTKEEFEKSVDDISSKIEKELKYPVVTKPMAEGSSVGVNFVKNKSDLQKALKAAFKWDSEVLVEEYVRGQEFMCVVLGNENPVAMQPSEVEFIGDIFDYESKYMPGKAQYHTPIRTSKKKVEEIQKLSTKIYKMLEIQGYGRVDGFLVDDTKIVITEAHTGTIMVPSSYVFQQASVTEVKIKTKAGTKAETTLNPKTLITTIIDLGIDAYEKRKVKNYV